MFGLSFRVAKPRGPVVTGEGLLIIAHLSPITDALHLFKLLGLFSLFKSILSLLSLESFFYPFHLTYTFSSKFGLISTVNLCM